MGLRDDESRALKKLAPGLILLLCLIVASSFYFGIAFKMSWKFGGYRGVYDDVCYVRQAQLFRSKGFIGGLDTDNGNARYILRTADGLRLHGSFTSVPCHSYIPATDKLVMQYPPGTGALLALFPRDVQVPALYIVSTTAVFIALCCSLFAAPTFAAMIALAIAGCVTLRIMDIPGNASYSMAATIPLCVLLAFLTVMMFEARSWTRRSLFAGTAGLILGLLVDLRISSGLLGAGYGAVLAFIFVRRPTRENFVRPGVFAVGLIAGVLPTLAANLINSGNPFHTTYSGADVALPDFSWQILKSNTQYYFQQSHGAINVAAILLTAVAASIRKYLPLRSAHFLIWIVACNLVFNLGYFITHQTTTPYYSVAVAILSIWTLVFAWYISEATRPLFPADDKTMRQQARGLRIALGVMTVLALCAFWPIVTVELAKRASPQTQIKFETKSVIWTDGENWSGVAASIEYYLNRHAVGGLQNLPADSQLAMMAAVARDRRPQYFVDDNAAMAKMVKLADQVGEVKYAGEAFGRAVYRLDVPQD